MPKKIIDEYTDRDDLSRYKKYELRHPEKLKKKNKDRWLNDKENQNKRIKKWRENNPERYRELARNSDRKRRLESFGLSFEDFEKVFEEQKHSCAICKTSYPTGRGWHLDHDHKTNKFRGILCHACNLLLGHAHDDVEILLSSIKYLEDRNENSSNT